MEQYFDETKGDLKYILEEQRRKETNGELPNDSKPKKKYWFNRFSKWVKHLFTSKKNEQKNKKDIGL